MANRSELTPVPRSSPTRVGRLDSFESTVLGELAVVAAETGAVNLVGKSGVRRRPGDEARTALPDDDGPPEMLLAAIDALGSGYNQYPPGPGVPALRRAVATHQSRFYGVDVDPDTEVLITFGATEGIAATLLALTQPGDEVIIFEPYYPPYAALIHLAGAQRSVVTLRPPNWEFDPDELRKAITPRSRVLILNSPHSPTGRAFTEVELRAMAEICEQHDLIVITDEVYEHVIFEGPHVPFASVPGMRERTITASSAAKTLSVTGWKTGWVTGPADLISRVFAVKQALTFGGGTPFQHAAAVGLNLPPQRIGMLTASLRERRDLLCNGLERLGWTVLRPDGTYFANVDVRSLGYGSGYDFSQWLARTGVVAVVPTDLFYDSDNVGRDIIRLSFCQPPELIEEALERLAGVQVRGSG